MSEVILLVGFVSLLALAFNLSKLIDLLRDWRKLHRSEDPKTIEKVEVETPRLPVPLTQKSANASSQTTLPQ